MLDTVVYQLQAPTILTEGNNAVQHFSGAWIEQCFDLHTYRGVGQTVSESGVSVMYVKFF